MEQYTQVPNIILDDWIKNMNPSAFKVLMAICRKTLGWQKESDYISQSQIMELTALSKNSVIRALKELKDKELINTIEKPGITTNYTLNLTSAKSEPVPNMNPTSAKSEPELVPKVNTQKKDKETIQNKYYTDEIKGLLEVWNRSHLPNHSVETIKRNIKKRHIDIIKDCGIEEVIAAIAAYNVVLNSQDYWFKYKFTFWRFLEKIDTFLDSADPLNNYKIKSKQQEPKKQTVDNLYPNRDVI